jgi:uncharacterized coiled-coil DUF342 family protein
MTRSDDASDTVELLDGALAAYASARAESRRFADEERLFHCEVRKQREEINRRISEMQARRLHLNRRLMLTAKSVDDAMARAASASSRIPPAMAKSAAEVVERFARRSVPMTNAVESPS